MGVLRYLNVFLFILFVILLFIFLFWLVLWIMINFLVFCMVDIKFFRGNGLMVWRLINLIEGVGWGGWSLGGSEFKMFDGGCWSILIVCILLWKCYYCFVYYIIIFIVDM